MQLLITRCELVPWALNTLPVQNLGSHGILYAQVLATILNIIN